MDKHSNNKTQIKIKINGQERPYKEEMEIHNWNKGEQETAAGSENLAQEEQFDWILPDVDDNQVGEFKKIYYSDTASSSSLSKKMKNKGKSIFPGIIFSIVTAVTIGIIIGFFMLKVVIYESANKEKAPATTNNAETTSMQNTTTSIPSLNTVLIQGGVFKNAEPTVNTIKSKGLPVIVLEMEGNQYIYIGTAGNIDTAKSLANEYKKLGVKDVYAKELAFDGKSLSNGTKEETQLINESVSLFQTISQEMANVYLTSKANSQTINSISKKIEKIEAIKNINNSTVKALRDNQMQSYQSLVNFQKSSNKKELLKGQQALLNYIQQFNQLK